MKNLVGGMMVSKPKAKNTEKKQKVGRPAYQINKVDEAKLKSLLTFGIPQERIATHMGVSLKTLIKHYPEIFEECKECKDEAVEHALFYQATVLNLPASTIWYTKSQMRDKYNDKSDLNVNIDFDTLFNHIADKLPD